MSDATFSRRWFLRATATATVALVAARVLPVSAVPLEGKLHQVIYADVIRWLRREFIKHIQTHKAPPVVIYAGPALFAAYEAELSANQRFGATVISTQGWDTLYFKGVRVEHHETAEPWMLAMVAHAH